MVAFLSEKRGQRSGECHTFNSTIWRATDCFVTRVLCYPLYQPTECCQCYQRPVWPDIHVLYCSLCAYQTILRVLGIAHTCTEDRTGKLHGTEFAPLPSLISPSVCPYPLPVPTAGGAKNAGQTAGVVNAGALSRENCKMPVV